MRNGNRAQFVRLCDCGCGQPTLLAPEDRENRGWTKGQPQARLAGHMRGRAAKPGIERFMALTEKRADGCWIWTGSVNESGYGRFTERPLGTQYAHRWSYMFYVGPIADGLEIDHLCRVRACVNPEHLEAVPGRVNFLRSANPVAVAITTNRCKRGHEFTEENTYVHPKTGHRTCRKCRAASAAAGRRAS